MQLAIEPLNWVIVIVVLSLLFLALRKQHLSKRFLLLALADLLLIGWLPTSEVFLRALEDASPKASFTQASDQPLSGIIILGGAIEGSDIFTDRGEVSIYASAERITKAFELIRKYPQLPFIFSGFSGRLSPKGPSEADAFKQLITEQGLADRSGYYENQSRNTYENVLYLKPMMAQVGQQNIDGTPQPWLLITSASHMYRALKIFEKQDLSVIPIPVDYQTAKNLRWGTFDLEEGVQNWNKLTHEVLGLLAYWITGKI
ncbi:YdcF family protein [Polynucleobacter brandtiae]|uniref:YdcF family protein n=1 Tax=Polynucleobacter brandtiae TaxID=1938816 RepID=UPI001E5EEFE4|nr:YdcF family protein [Polynucleobacter brandtiae]